MAEKKKRTKAEEDQIKRDILFVPCQSKAKLHNWIEIFLGLDFPDCIVDPESTSSPMDMVWEIYSKLLNNEGNNFSRVLYYASRDGYKCCKKGTWILSKSRGLVAIENVVIGEEVWSGKAWRKVTDWIHDGEKKSSILELNNGLRLVVSPIHRVWAWKPNSTPDWCRVSELTSDDIVCVDSSHNYQNIGDYSEADFETGYICGALQGDGCLSLMDKYNMVCMSASDPVVLTAFKAACLKFSGRMPKNSPPPRGYDWTIISKEMVAQLKALGLTCSYSYQKSIPHAAFKSRSAMAGFVSGLFDTDGSITAKKDVVFQLTAETMCRELQIMLAALGVNARFRSNKKLYGKQKHIVHHVIVPQNEISSLLASGIQLRAKKAKSVEAAKIKDAHDSVPMVQLRGIIGDCRTRGGKDLKGRMTRPTSGDYKTITRDKALRISDWAVDRGLIDEATRVNLCNELKNRWVGVKSVNEGVADFYDLTVEGDHSYWSDGLISHNTLGASILELLVILHLGRDVAHMAAIEAQSKKSQLYVKKFLARSILRDYLIGDSQEMTWVARFNDKITGKNLTEAEYKKLPDDDKDNYTEIRNYIKVVICTMAGANSDHVPFMVIDEVDVVTNPKAYDQAQLIPSPINGLFPITLLTSTRKISTGLVQKEIDNAVDQDGDTRLHIRHWNLIDVTEACPPTRHLPQEPKIPIYVNDDELRALSEEKFNALNEEDKVKFKKEEGYTGCLKNCKIFAACKGRLATLQKSKSLLLKPIDHAINQFRTVSLPMAQAELLCRKPSTEGLIYPNLDRATHMLTPAQMAEAIVGTSFPASMKKAELIAIMKTRDMLWYSGMDFGFTHNFAVVTGAVDGYRCFIVDVIEQAELMPNEQIHACDKQIKHLNPSVYADPENPQMVKTFRSFGYRMREWSKGPGSVIGGIDVVRMRLRPAIGDPLLFFLAGDANCELLFKRLSKYHWVTDATGVITDKPDEKDDDSCDALRYLVMNVFGTKQKVRTAPETGPSNPNSTQEGVYSKENFIKKWLQDNGITQDGGTSVKIKKGRFLADLG